jgi:hypothetical protein
MRPLALWTDAQRAAADAAAEELRMFSEDVAADGGKLVVVYVPNAYQIAPSECAVGRYFDGLDAATVLPFASALRIGSRP